MASKGSANKHEEGKFQSVWREIIATFVASKMATMMCYWATPFPSPSLLAKSDIRWHVNKHHRDTVTWLHNCSSFLSNALSALLSPLNTTTNHIQMFISISRVVSAWDQYNSNQEGLTKDVVFWDIKTQFVPHSRHITSQLQNSAS
jgi:hypothetical protein